MQSTLEKTQSIKEYYGKILNSSKDLKTSACCLADSVPLHVKEILRNIEPEILNKFYGCGSPIPDALEDCVVLDLGCGTGRDAYVVSKLTGQKGQVIGVDMNDSQLEVANSHLDSQMAKFGFSPTNLEFRKGYIEDLREIGFESNSVDVVISNCVINLSFDKEAVFREIFRVLKNGGELYFSDVFAGRRVPGRFLSDPVLLGECLAGAMYTEDFRRMLRRLGCLDYRVVSQRPITLDDPAIRAKLGMIDFCSRTIRAFKLTSLEDICEDYGQVAEYCGTIPQNPHQFILDDHHIFKTGKPMLVCGNTAAMLAETRYAKHFKIMGDRSSHYGPFPCSPAQGKHASADNSSANPCC